MNREETIKLLALLRANYPNVKIQDPAATVTAFQMNLEEYSAESMLAAAKLHMKTSPYFPEPSDLIAKRVKGEMIYSKKEPALNPPTNFLPRAKVTTIPDGMSEEDFLDNLWKDMVDLDNEIEEKNLENGWLPYET